MMKPFLLLLLLVSGYCLQAQSKSDVYNSVPSEVRNAFLKTFPTGKVSWEKEKNGDYEGTFKLNDKKTSATYDTSGHLKEVESEIQKSELPAAVRTYLEKYQPGRKIKEVSRITDSQNVTTYEVELKGKGKHELLFDANGKLIQ